MNTYEADQFMEKHPEVAVRVEDDEKGLWVAWDHFRADVESIGNIRRMYAHTREGAITNYRDKYHIVGDDLTPHCTKCGQPMGAEKAAQR